MIGINGAIADCLSIGAHVCTYSEMLSTCSANPTEDVYIGDGQGWYGDSAGGGGGGGGGGGSRQSYFGTWNRDACLPNNDGAPRHGSQRLQYRCCKSTNVTFTPRFTNAADTRAAVATSHCRPGWTPLNGACVQPAVLTSEAQLRADGLDMACMMSEAHVCSRAETVDQARVPEPRCCRPAAWTATATLERCAEPGREYRCECAAGWGGPRCAEEFDPCASGPCANTAACTRESFDHFTCECATGWAGDLCAEEINPCLQVRRALPFRCPSAALRCLSLPFRCPFAVFHCLSPRFGCHSRLLINRSAPGTRPASTPALGRTSAGCSRSASRRSSSRAGRVAT